MLLTTADEKSSYGLRTGIRIAVTILRNSFYTFVSTVLSKGFLFLFVVLGANVLGPERWGTFTFAITLVTLLRIFTDFGFQVLATREIAVNPSMTGFYLWNMTAIKLFLSVASILMIALVLRALRFDRASILITVIYSLALLPHSLYTSLLAIFNALERMELSGVVQIAMSAAHLVAGYVILQWKPDVIVLAFSFPLAMGVASGLGFLILLRRILAPLPQFSLAAVRDLLRMAYPFMFINVLTYAFQKVDVLLLSVIKGHAEVGWYGAAYNFLDVIMFLPMAYVVAIFPRLSRAVYNEDKNLQSVLNQSLRHLFSLGLFFTATVVVFADQLILWTYKEAFVNSVAPLRVLILGLLFMFPNSLMGFALFSTGKQKQLVRIFVFNLTVNVSLNLFAIPEYGSVGAALAMLVSLMLSFLLHSYLVNKYLVRLNLLKLVPRPAAVTLVYVGLLVVLYPLNKVIALILSFSSYLLLYWVSGILRPEEKQLICSICLNPKKSLHLLLRTTVGDK